MNGEEPLGILFKDVGRPEGTVDAGAAELQLGSEAAIEDLDVVERRGALGHS